MNTKQILLGLALAATTLTATAQRIKGSDTVLPLSQEAAEAYMKSNRGARLTVTGGGSGVGIQALMAGTTDIAQASRRMKFTERQKMQEGGHAPKEVIIAYDALAVVVNPKNDVSRLTRQQLEGIFTGKIKNWKEVGGADLKIVPYSRETSSGTYEFFKEHVLGKKNYMNGIMSMPATGAIIQSVSQTPGAIGYVGLAYLNKSVKALAVSFNKGKSYTAPSMATAKNKSYPIVRPLYYYYDSKSEAKVKPFISYMLSDKGQAVVERVGFVAIK